MDKSFIDMLLSQNESDSLDFKRDQYPFSNATIEQKSELLKDVLAFANTPRIKDAFILIGVEEVLAGKNNVVGVTEHLEDSALQQFINSKTNRQVHFSYSSIQYDEISMGLITIPIGDERPYYVRKDYGKVKPNYVYYRQGSATAVADPDYIAKIRSDRQFSIAQQDRINTHQDAYNICINLIPYLHSNSSEKMKAIESAKNWYNRHNIYLKKDIQVGFPQFLHELTFYPDYHASLYDAQTKMEKDKSREELFEIFHRIMNFPQNIQESAATLFF